MLNRNQKIVLTGGPGSGKSTLLEALKESGYLCYKEVSRDVIEQGKEQGMENYFLEDPLVFSEALFNARLNDYKKASELSFKADKPYIFFDRGLSDVTAYLATLNIFQKEWEAVAQEHLYDKVIFLPPWKEIYHTDEQRMESYAKAEELSAALYKSYEKQHRDILILPKGNLEERMEILLSSLSL